MSRFGLGWRSLEVDSWAGWQSGVRICTGLAQFRLGRLGGLNSVTQAGQLRGGAAPAALVGQPAAGRAASCWPGGCGKPR